MKLVILLSLFCQFSWAGIELTDTNIRQLVTEHLNIVVSMKADYKDGEYIKDVPDRNIFQEIIYFEDFRSGAKLKVHSILTAYGHDWDIDELMHEYNFSCITDLEQNSSVWKVVTTTCQKL